MKRRSGCLNLIARAGCGKTTTLIEFAKELFNYGLPRKWDTAFIGAYNRPIADEIKAKLQEAGCEKKTFSDGSVVLKIDSNTMHGAGYAAWWKVAPEACDNLDEKKCEKMLEAFIGDDVKRRQRVEPYKSFILDCVSMAKQRAFGVLCSIDDQAKWYDMIDHFGLDENLEEDADIEYGVKCAIWLYKQSLLACRKVIDFDDMILAPLYFKAKMWQYSWVMIDEAQDTNPARRALALRMLAPGGRLIAVGDPNQAIYGFTGADSDSMDLIKAALNSTELPLNVTRRCPKQVVRLARRWVPDFVAHESAPEGVVRNVLLDEAPKKGVAPESGSFWAETLTKEDVILCRNTKPLIEMAYTLLRRGVGCRVEGRKIGEGLTKLISRFKVKTLSALLNKLPDHKEKEMSRWMAKDKAEKAANVEDTCETVITLAESLLAEGKQNVSDLIEFIESLFGDTLDGEPPNVLTLSTVHKSKGREWNRVYLLGRAMYMPSKWARKEWQMQQESNLMYVAVTRAKAELIEVIVLEA